MLQYIPVVNLYSTNNIHPAWKKFTYRKSIEETQ